MKVDKLRYYYIDLKKMTTDFPDIPADFSLKYHPNYLKISQKSKQQGLNYFLQGYIHKIKN